MEAVRVTRSRGYKLNMDDYESYDLFASVTVGPEDLGLNEEEVAALEGGEHAEMVSDLIYLAGHTLKEVLHTDLSTAAPQTKKTSFLRRVLKENNDG